MNFKNIYIGQIINERVAESGIEISRICNFFKCDEEKIEEMYKAKSLETEILLRWSKLMGYDFFRLYSQHLILYAPEKTIDNRIKVKRSSLPQFRKNIYTKDLIDFIVEQIESSKMTKDEVIIKYRIPKTTLYKWLRKYKN
ncbi:transposase [Chryseobacterium culicis]|uniref:transposase n=1 Tax=Chryseobacterium culicis TaxID=680127 RepID=UPI00289AFB2A|nr:transposase [Chryseobacterium culicis]